MGPRNDVYRNLQRHLDRMPVGFPATTIGVEIDLLRSIFTPEQAQTALHLDYKYKSIDQIFQTAREHIPSKSNLQRILDESVSNGGIARRRRNGVVQYALLPFLLWGMYEHQLKRLDQTFLDLSKEYISGEFGLEFATGRLPKMRVIPIQESIEIEQRISTYDELHRLIEQAGEQIAVQECFCRKSRDMQGEHCRKTDRRELCMSFGDQAELYIEEGWARRISQLEALEMARLNEQEGLVLMPANQQEPTFMCACCNDCCQMLTMIQIYPKPAEVLGGNYYAEINLEACTGMELCVERCPMAAVTLSNGFASINMDRCIGCGLCVPICPEDAIAVVKMEQETQPPVTAEELYDFELAKKSTLTGKIRNMSLKTFIRIMTRLSSTSQS